MAQFEGLRTAIPEDIKPQQTVRIAANISAPQLPGDYVLRFSLVQEWVSWFDAVNRSNAINVPLKVIPK